MELSSTLVKKFAEVVQENAERDGYYVYGTGIVSNGEKYVQLDGSDSVTSVSLASDLSTGDRVIVYVQDHVANVIGNITYPSSGRGLIEVSENLLDFESLTIGNLDTINANIENIYTNYVSTAYLESNYITSEYIVANYLLIEDAWLTYATIDDLTATNARIDDITATEITVEYLDANYANIDDLHAVNEKVNNLEVTYATIEWVEATYATIENLDAAAAYIYELNADVANIKNLLAGVAGVGILETIHLTADNVTIDNAVIKDAMIDSITADKITAGTIYTAKIRIQTDENDESLYIDNSLIQMSENDLVRFQAGKDATGEYGLYIWNSEGKIMFDATGATSDGIGKEVIVNTHVSDDANIAGYKLDIASVASELNADGSITVDAARVYIDGNTLDYALSEITDLIYGISMDGLKNFTVYFCLYDSDTEWPPLPDEIVPALTDEAETDYSFTDVYDPNDFWTEDQPQAEDGQYVWFIYWLEYEDGTTMWSNPICLTDGFIRRQTNYIFTELEVIQGEISAKVWMTDIEESLNTEISELWAQLDITIGDVLIEVGDLIYDSVGTLTEQVAAIEVEYNNISMTVESIQDNYVTKGSLVLALDEETGVATLTAEVNLIEFYTDQISIDSTYFKLYKDGYIEATSGLIGDWNIGLDSLYTNDKTNINTNSYGICLSNYGIGIGNVYLDHSAFEVDNYGNLYLDNLFFSSVIYARSYNSYNENFDFYKLFELESHYGYDDERDNIARYGVWLSIDRSTYIPHNVHIYGYDFLVENSDGGGAFYLYNSGFHINAETTATYRFQVRGSVDSPQISIYNQESSTETFFNAMAGWNDGVSVSLGVGSGGNNRGVYDSTSGSTGWIIYKDSSDNIHIGGSTLTYSGTTYGYRVGNIVWIRIYGVSASTALSALNSIGLVPRQNSSFPMIFLNNGNMYVGYIYYNGSWSAQVSASYGGSPSAGSNYSSGSYYGTIVFTLS